MIKAMVTKKNTEVGVSLIVQITILNTLWIGLPMEYS